MSATVIYANLGLSASALGAASYTTAVTAATTDARVYANGAVSAAQAAQTDTAFAAATMSNLGMTAAVIGQAAYDALLPAYAAYLASVGVANRGVVVVQLATIVAGLTADATFGKAATNLVSASSAALAHSSNAANTTALAIDVATVPALVTSFALTTSTTDNLPGSGLNDIFAAVASGLASANTLNATDKVDGGAGTDALNITLDTDFTGFSTGSVSNVETVSLTNGNTAAKTFNAKGITGAATFDINAGDNTFTLAGLSSIPAVNLTNQNGSTQGTLNVEFAAASIPTGTADAMSVTLNGVGRAAVAATATTAAITANPSILNLSNIETANVTTAGSTVNVDFAGTLRSVNLAGSATTVIAATPTTLTSFDASAATGAVTATLTTGGTAGRITAIKGGTAVDRVTADVADLAANASVSGGAGADVLTLNGSAGGTKQYVLADVETVAFGVTGALTFSGAKATGLTTVTSTSTNTAAVTMVAMGAGDLNVNATGSATVAGTTTVDAGDISSDSTGNVTVSYSAGAATLAAATTADAPQADYTFAEMTGALTVNVGSMVTTSGTTVTANKATSLVINTTSGTTTATTPVQLTSLSGSVTANKAASVVINSAGLIGATGAGNQFAVNAPDATSASINQGSSAAFLNLNTAKLATLNVTAGNSFDLTGSTLSALQVVTADVSRGTLTVPAIATASTVTLSGAGVSAASPGASTASLGNLGQTSNTYGMSLVASGLRGGLKTGDVTGGNSYTTSIDVSKVSALNNSSFNVKAVEIGVIGTNTAGAVTVNAAGTVGQVELGNVNSLSDITVTASPTQTFKIGDVASASNTGNVTVNLDGTVGAVTIGSFTGNNVTVKASDTIGGVTGPGAAANTFNVSAKTSANVEVSSLANSTVTITSSSTSTGLNVALKGGSLNDAVTVTGVNGTTSLVLTGDLGVGTDTVTVNGSSYSGTSTQTISLAGLANYETSTVSGSNGKDVIVGGAGRDNITGGTGQDTLTGGAGKDVFVFNLGDSPVSAPDTITDFAAGTNGDTITWGGGNIARALQSDVTGTGITINANSVVAFATTPASLAAAVTAVSTALDDTGDFALFTFGGTSYAFLSDGETGSTTNDVVIILTGVTLPTTALSAGTSTADAATGLTGSALIKQ